MSETTGFIDERWSRPPDVRSQAVCRGLVRRNRPSPSGS